jgi:PD-(D/E)XK endonuclease
MTEKSIDKRSWSDSQLASAVAASRSWRGVMRELGLCVTSAGAIRGVKRHVARLGLDTSHFSGQRRWSDAQLRRAVANAYSWPELFTDLALTGSGDDRTRVKAHAIRLGLDLSRLEGLSGDVATHPEFKPDVKHLREAGTAIAVMWFLLCGYAPSIPIEPALYDLLVSLPDGIKRVQVKTTTYNKAGWAVSVGRRPYTTDNRGPLVPYDPELIDFFFILDGELTMYVIPSRVIAGRVGILLSNYSEYIVGSAAFLMKGANYAA